jgi:hypothetical protein
MRKTLITFAFAVLAALVVAPGAASAQNTQENLFFDVAEDGTRFSFDEAPLLPNGFPAYGNPFVTIGYLYNSGRLTVDSSGTVNGVNANGTPQFPNDVKGTWHCRGWFIGDGAATLTGAWDITHQIYDITGKGQIMTDGLELVDIGVQGDRAVTGGTDLYHRSSGEQRQTLLGFNQTGGVGLRVHIRVFR